MGRGQLLNDFRAIARREKPSRPRAFFINAHLWAADWAGVSVRSYMLSPDVKLRAQLEIMRAFPEVLFSGIFPEFSTGVDASAWGCRVEWVGTWGPTTVHPILKSASDYASVSVPDLSSDPGWFGMVRQHYEYMMAHDEAQAYVRDMQEFSSMPILWGPGDLGPMLRGHEALMMDMIDHPRETHELMKKCAEFLIKNIEWHNRLRGGAHMLMIADHLGVMMGRPHFEEFLFPYLREAFTAFPGQPLWFHCDDNLKQSIDLVGELGATFYQFGPKNRVADVKAAVGGKVAMVGNLDAMELLKSGTCEQVKEEVLSCFREAGAGTAYMVSAAGGLAPGTPKRNVQAVADAADEYGRASREI